MSRENLPKKAQALICGFARVTYLSHTGSVIFAEARRSHAIDTWRDLTHAETILLLCICAQRRNGQNLPVLRNALLQLPIQNPEASGIIGGPERVREARHYYRADADGEHHVDSKSSNNDVKYPSDDCEAGAEDSNRSEMGGIGDEIERAQRMKRRARGGTESSALSGLKLGLLRTGGSSHKAENQRTGNEGDESEVTGGCRLNAR